MCFNSSRITSGGDLQDSQCRQIIPYTVSQNSHSPVSKASSLCRTSIYHCLPSRWKGICALVLLFPPTEVISGHEEVPLSWLMSPWHKWAIQFVPILATLGATAGLATGITSSITYYHQLCRSADRGYPTGSHVYTNPSESTGLLCHCGPIKLLWTGHTNSRTRRPLPIPTRGMFLVNQSEVVKDKKSR